ncbi:hypothetical protein BGX38DRAFT_1273719 [Terfezia claveryi]|nr:hypothetical protein BGX38DRAFT_1273719 [Terfezia claveryi]
MNGHSLEVHRPLRASTASTVAGGRTASPESYTRRSTRRRRGPAPSATIDLTSTQASQNPTGLPVAKRARTNASQTSHQSSSDTPLAPTATSDQKPTPWLLEDGIEEIDLTEADSDDKLLLAKAQEDLLKMQKADGPEKPKLADFKCVICLDDPTNLAATPCGHMFCDFCLQGALRAGQPPGAKHGRCPVCRRKVNIKDVVPLEIKVLSKLRGKGKGKGRAG